MKDHYRLLGLPPDCEPDEIKAAFRKLALEHHPDKGGDGVRFLEIHEAYEVLIDPDRRAQYDIAYVEAFPGYSLVDAETGEELEIEYEEADQVPRPNPQPDSGKGLTILLLVGMPMLGFGFGMLFSGDPLTALAVAGLGLLGGWALGALMRDM